MIPKNIKVLFRGHPDEGPTSLDNVNLNINVFISSTVSGWLSG